MISKQVLRKQSFISLTIISQFFGFLAGLLCGQLLSDSLSILVTHILASCLAAGYLRLPMSWLILNAALPLVLLLSLYVTLPTFLLLGIFLVLFLIYAPSLISRVPYYPTHLPMYQEVLNFLPKNQVFSFLDAGCGNAALLIFLARSAPTANFTGVELSPLSYLLARWKVRQSGLKNINIRYKNFMYLDFGQYDLIYAFLAPPIMPALWEKASAEMNVGQQLLINSFPLPIKEDQLVVLESERVDRSGSLYHYIIK